MPACSGVTTCLSEGETECNFLYKQCPPCVYALTGGDYSCYSRQDSKSCPFSGTYVECDHTSTTDKGSSGASETPSTNSRGRASSPTVNSPTPSPHTPGSDGGDLHTTNQTSLNATSSSANNVIPDPTPATLKGSDSTPTSATPVPKPDPTPTPATSPPDASNPTQSSANGSGEKVVATSTQSTTTTPAAVNLVLVGGAVALVAVVMVFVVRRVMTRKKLAASACTVSSAQNSAWSDRTLDSDASSRNMYSTCAYKDDENMKDITMLSDSQASSSFGSGVYGQQHHPTDPRTTADFSKYGENAQHGASSQFYTDYTVSAGPEHSAAGAVAGAGAATPLSTREFEAESTHIEQFPLTVSQLMPKVPRGDQEEGYGTRRQLESQRRDAAQAPTSWTQRQCLTLRHEALRCMQWTISTRNFLFRRQLPQAFLTATGPKMRATTAAACTNMSWST